MKEQMLEIAEKKKGDKTYYSIDLRKLEPESFVIVEKQQAEGFRFESQTLKKFDGTPLISYSFKVLYRDQPVSFFLAEAPAKNFAAIGGAGDKVKISCKEEKIVNPKTKVKMLVNRYSFEKV